MIRGTLAELIGPEGLPVDRLSRRVGFRDAADRQLKFMEAEAWRALAALARGVSDGTTLGCARLAHEFVLLRAWPTPYETAGAFAVLKLQAFLLESDWVAELCQLRAKYGNDLSRWAWGRVRPLTLGLH